ncbi:hypothetical protein BDL97_17G034500 [Sphagnum fallax]|nr:hypothetical protein BDL97_17G034500 [Sphagnum fallax]
MIYQREHRFGLWALSVFTQHSDVFIAGTRFTQHGPVLISGCGFTQHGRVLISRSFFDMTWPVCTLHIRVRFTQYGGF